MIKVNRADFLRTLESVAPGLSPRDIVEQSSCFVFRNGRVYTYNDEVACRAPSGLPAEYIGAVQAKPLLTILGKYAEDEVTINIEKSRFVVRGKGRETWVRTEAEIVLPLENVKFPKKEAWLDLNPEFAEAVAIVQECASSDEDLFALTCVHLHPKWVEACDNDQITRYWIKTGLDAAVCVKRDALKSMTSLGMVQFTLSDAWVFFKNPLGLVLACRLWAESYPDTSKFFDVKGEKATLPKGLVEACDKASVFSAENGDNNVVQIHLESGRLKLRAEGVSGGHSETKKVAYKGNQLAFHVSPKILSEIVRKHNDCVMSPTALLVSGEKWKYVTCLEVVDSKKSNDEESE